MTLLTIPELSTRTVVINDPDLRMCYQLTIPARSEEVIRREGSALAGGFVASNVAIGICFLLGMTGVGLIAVGLVAGVAGAMRESGSTTPARTPAWSSR